MRRSAGCRRRRAGLLGQPRTASYYPHPRRRTCAVDFLRPEAAAGFLESDGGRKGEERKRAGGGRRERNGQRGRRRTFASFPVSLTCDEDSTCVNRGVPYPCLELKRRRPSLSFHIALRSWLLRHFRSYRFSARNHCSSVRGASARHLQHTRNTFLHTCESPSVSRQGNWRRARRKFITPRQLPTIQLVPKL